jgi:hypothetical protein
MSISGSTEQVKYLHVIDEEFDYKPIDYITTSYTYNPSKIELDSFHYHEVMDRLYLINNNIEDFLLNHPVVQKHKNVKNKIDKALMILADTYQLVGNMKYNLKDKPIYTQKEVDKMLSNAGVLTGKDAKIFYNNIANPKAITPEIKERMRNLFNKVNENNKQPWLGVIETNNK